MCNCLYKMEIGKEGLVMRKRTGQSGVYYVKSRNKWVAQYNDIDPQTGSSKRKSSYFKTEEEARKYIDCIMYQKQNPLYIENNGIPLAELMRMNLKRKYDSHLIHDSQYTRVEQSIKKIERSYIGSKKIDELTSEEIQGYLNSLTSSYSNSYIKKIHSEIKQAYTYAMKKGYLMRNPMDDVIKPKSLKQDKVVEALSVEDERKLIFYLDKQTITSCPYKNVYLIQLCMGLRVGEALALTNHDIDLAHQEIHITRSLKRDINERPVMGENTKTQAGRRVVPIPKFMYNTILEQMKEAEHNEDKLLFYAPQNKYVDSKNVNKQLKKIGDKLGIENITTHVLRHTYGTRAIESGMPAVMLQRLMGHNDVSVTLNTYTSVFNKFKESEIDKMNDYYLNQDLITEDSMKELPEQTPIEVEAISQTDDNSEEVKQKVVENSKKEIPDSVMQLLEDDDVRELLLLIAKKRGNKDSKDDNNKAKEDNADYER